MPDISSSFSSATKLSRPKMERRPRHSCLYSHWWRKSQSRWDKPITHQKRNYFCLNIHLFFFASSAIIWKKLTRRCHGDGKHIWEYLIKILPIFLNKTKRKKKNCLFSFWLRVVGKDTRLHGRLPPSDQISRRLGNAAWAVRWVCVMSGAVYCVRQQATATLCWWQIC